MQKQVKRLPIPRTVSIALNLNDASGRSTLAGIFRYVNSGQRWQLKIQNNFDVFDRNFVKHAKANGIDGIIAGLPEASNCFRDLLRSEIPTAFNVLPEIMPLPPAEIRRTAFCDVDNADIASAAFNHFARYGNFRSVAFISDRAERRWSIEREKTFARLWNDRGIVVQTFLCSSDQRPLDRESLSDFLLRLPKPSAIWCAYDITAVEVAQVCVDIKISVPDQIAILGSDNDEVLCRYATPNLSSVAINHEELGYQTAALLNRLMTDKRARPKTKLIHTPVGAVVLRDSTRRILPAAHLIGEALRFINANVTAGIAVMDVIRHLGVSRPLADLRFRQILNKSIGRTICEARIKEIKNRLLKSDASFAQIAASCSFSSPSRLSHFFRKETGLSMKEFLLAHQSGRKSV